MFIFRKVISLNLSRKQYILLNISLNRHASSYKYLDDAKASMTRDKDKIFLHDKFNWFTFGKILNLSKALSVNIKKSANKSDLNSAKVGVYCTNTYSYLISILAIWLANGVPFCLSKLYPPKFIEYYLNDSECNLIINSQDRMSMNTVMSHEFDYLLEKKKISNYKLVENDFYKLDSSNKNSNAAKDYADLIDSLCVDEKNREAFLLYTSGTSGPPKGITLIRKNVLNHEIIFIFLLNLGVSITFENFFSSIETIVDSYMWTSDDFILNPLPLNHYSGLVYCLMTPFFMGAQVDLLPKFNADVVWSKLLDQNSKLNMMIAVPTIYSQLVMAYESNSNSLKTTYNKDLLQDILKVKMRLIGSGSAPLSLKTYNDWLALTNYRIVERYGMSEIGMALTNPLIENSESLIANSKTKRLAGYVGKPYGKVRVRIVDLTSCQVLVESNWKDDKFHENCGEEIFGELQIKGPNVFKEYYKQPEQTKQSFTEDGWFKTGLLKISYFFKHSDS